jgi:hypothetical protein
MAKGGGMKAQGKIAKVKGAKKVHKGKAKAKAMPKGTVKPKSAPLKKKPAKAEEKPLAMEEGEEEEDHEGDEEVENEDMEEEVKTTQRQQRAFKTALLTAPQVVLDTVKKVQTMGWRTGKRQQMSKMVLAFAKQKWEHKMFKAMEELETHSKKAKTNKALPKYLMMAKYGGLAMFKEALKEGEIEEVENPEGGPPLYQVVTYSAEEATVHRKKISLDKSKSDNNQEDMSFDDMDTEWGFKKSGKTQAQLVNELGNIDTLSRSQAPPPNASGSSGSGGAPLPIEDAKEWDRLQCKLEEALRSFAKMSVSAEKAIGALASSGLGLKHRDTVQELLTVAKDKRDTLHHIAVHGCVPGQVAKLGVVGLRAIVAEFHTDFKSLQQAVQMAQPLMKKDSEK